MSIDKAEKLAKILELLKQDTISSTEIEKFLAMVLKVIQNTNENLKTLTEENKKEKQNLIESFIKEHETILNNIDTKIKNTESYVDSKTAKMMDDCKSLMEECKNLMPKDGEDGKDADEEKIIGEVLQKIKLPEYEKFILDGAEIVDQINKQPLVPENQIDYSHIKNTPEVTRVSGGARNVRVYDEGNIITKALRNIKFIGAGVSASLASDGSVIVSIGGGSGGYTVETPTGTVDGTNTSYTVTTAPVYIVSDGATYFENKGYTLSGLTITLTVPPADFIRSFYA